MTDSTQAELQEALRRIKSGRPHEAYPILDALLRADPDNDNAWWLMAHAVNDSQYKRTALENVVRLRPDFTEARRMLDALGRQPASSAALQSPPPDTPFYYGDAQPIGPPPVTLRSTWPGVALGGVGGGVGGMVWVMFVILTEAMEARVAMVVGVLVGCAVLMGTKHRRSRVMALVSVAITLCTMVLSQYAIERHLNAQAGDIITALAARIEQDPITLLFWGVALVASFAIPFFGRGKN